ncbi:hypothetical protein ASE00_12910 [Sphingomonas sp. Root710]|nr:hypothetical protein ASE00_12910 [Sphingomonas sp. Root710]
MADRIVLEHQSRDPHHLILFGMIGTEPVLVEVDNAACMKLAGRGSVSNHQNIVDDHYGAIAEAAERLFDDQSFEAGGDRDLPHILVTALDLD